MNESQNFSVDPYRLSNRHFHFRLNYYLIRLNYPKEKNIDYRINLIGVSLISLRVPPKLNRLETGVNPGNVGLRTTIIPLPFFNDSIRAKGGDGLIEVNTGGKHTHFFVEVHVVLHRGLMVEVTNENRALYPYFQVIFSLKQTKTTQCQTKTNSIITSIDCLCTR